jgi:hypothetical protein
MNGTEITLWVLLYLALGYRAYIITKYCYIRDFYAGDKTQWTIGNRYSMLFWSLLIPPLQLFFIFFVWLQGAKSTEVDKFFAEKSSW